MNRNLLAILLLACILVSCVPKSSPSLPLSTASPTLASSTEASTLTIAPDQTTTAIFTAEFVRTVTSPTPSGSLCPASMGEPTYSAPITGGRSNIGFVRWNGFETYADHSGSYTYEYFYHQKYGLAAILFKDSGAIWLEELVCRSKGGAYLLKVIDEVRTPPWNSNESARFYCRDTANIDFIFVTIGHFVDQQQSIFLPTQGWRVDFDKQRLIELSNEQIEGLSCN